MKLLTVSLLSFLSIFPLQAKFYEACPKKDLQEKVHAIEMICKGNDFVIEVQLDNASDGYAFISWDCEALHSKIVASRYSWLKNAYAYD